MGYRGMADMAAGLLRHAGVAVRRVPRPEEIEGPPTATRGLVVELVGPAAIGKSTVFGLMRPALRKSWLFEQHTRIGRPGPVEADPGQQALLRQVYFARLRRLEDASLDLCRSAEVIRRMSEIVQMSVLAGSGGFPRGFVLEEGIGHFFAEQIVALDDAGAAAILAGRAFVLLLPRETGTLVERRIGRRRPGGTQGKVDAAAREAAALQAGRELAIYRDFAALCARLGLPHLVLEAEDLPRANADRALAFLGTLAGGDLSRARSGEGGWRDG